MTTTQGTIEVPSPVQFLIRDDHKRLLSYVEVQAKAGKNINIQVKGPAGCGKSTLPQQYAAARGLPLAVLEVGLLSEASQIFGKVDLRDGQTVYTPGLFTKAITTPNCIVHLQELNRPESDKTLNALFSVLDPLQRRIWIDDYQRFITVAPGVVFFASLNEGYEFIGTMPVDEALEDRFQVKLRLDYLPSGAEANLLILRGGLTSDAATEIVNVANQLRTNSNEQVHVSTRNLLEIANMVKYNIPLLDALRAVVALDDDKLESILSALHFGGIDIEQGASTYSFL